MSMIYGVVSRGGGPVPPEWMDAMATRAEQWPADHVAHHAASFGHIALRERSSYPGAPAFGFARTESHALILDGRIDNRRELEAALALQDGTDAQLALAAFRRWGDEFPSHLIGDFALAVLGRDRPDLMLVRDPMGIRPLFYSLTTDFIAFASNMDVLLALPFVDKAPDQRWLIDYIEKINSDDTTTPYRGMAFLPPASAMVVSINATRQFRHWSPPPLSDVLDITMDEAVTEFRRLFDEAVAHRLPARGPVACELSGGIDSGSIAVTAAPHVIGRGDHLLTLSHIANEEQSAGLHLFDERVQVRQIIETLPPGDHRWLDDSPKSQLAEMRAAVARHGGPHGRDFGSGQPRLAQIMREEDCRLILSGHGGDQLVTGHGSGFAESLAAAGDWRTLDQIEKPWRRPLWRTEPGRALLRWRALNLQRSAIAKKRRLTRADALTDRALFARRCDFPLRPAWGTIGERDRRIILSAQVAQRPQDSAVGSGPDGFAHTYPMLDRRLIEFCLRVPETFRRTPRQRRVLIRRAMAGRLPDAVRLRDNKHGGAALPVAASGFFNSTADYSRLFERHLDDPILAPLVDLASLIGELEIIGQSRRISANYVTSQFRRAAQLCIWSEAGSARIDP